MNPDELNVVILKWRGLFEELGLSFAIYQSMCLGLIRNGKFFNERVAEFAVLGDEIGPVLEQMMSDKKYRFQSENQHLAPHGLLYFEDCEIAPIYFKGGKALACMDRHVCLAWDEDLFRSWSTYRYLDMDWNLPSDPERYLAQSYGDWRTPCPHYSWIRDANNKVGWDDIVQDVQNV